MAGKGRKLIRRIALSIGILFALAMAVNWFMTYRLEDSLRKRLRTEIINATDGFYDFSFDKLSVGFFSGELMIKGLSLFPDSQNLASYKDPLDLPNFYFSIFIDTIDFKGVNLTWKRNYRHLSFDQFLVKSPSFKIVSPHKRKTDPTDSTRNKNLYESVSPYFDVIRAKHINFENADVEYTVTDSTVTKYKLKDFQFTAHQFVLDENSHNKEHLLFSEDFDFHTYTEQTVLDSKHFLLDLSHIQLTTIDSTAYIEGIHLRPKDPNWEDKRLNTPGSYVGVKVGAVELGGIYFRRHGADNLLDSKELIINNPEIEYYNVTEEQRLKDKVSVSPNFMSWSLYDITSPLLERIFIDEISIDSAAFKYIHTQEKESDRYTLERLDFRAYQLTVDSAHQGYNVVNLIKDFSIEASEVEGYLESKNTLIGMGYFKLSTLDKSLNISDIKLSPMSMSPSKNYIYGQLKALDILGIDYSDGLDADLIKLTKPEVHFTKGEQSLKGISPNKKPNKNILNKALDIFAPFISHVSVRGIEIIDGTASFNDKRNKNQYHLDDLSFYVKNFHINQETIELSNYFFVWDEYRIRFKNFDNLTPDKKYRIQIGEGDFNSTSGNMILTDLNVNPEPINTSSCIRINTPSAILLDLDEREVKKGRLSFKAFILDRPTIEITKKDELIGKKTEGIVKTALPESISFDILSIPYPSFSYRDESLNNSIKAKSTLIYIDSLRWTMNDSFSIHNIEIKEPFISIENAGQSSTSDAKSNIKLTSLGDLDIKSLNINKPVVKIKTPNYLFDFFTDNLSFDSLFWSHKQQSIFKISSFNFFDPNIEFTTKPNLEKTQINQSSLSKERLKKFISQYANEIELGEINVVGLNMKDFEEDKGESHLENKLVDTDFLLEDLKANLQNNDFNVGELAFKTYDIDFPVADSFYTFKIKYIDFSKRRGELVINNIHLKPNYPKFDFAYIHPNGADWFNVEIESVNLSGLDIIRFISDTILLTNKIRVNGVLLENMKNQKIEIEHNKMPLLYEQFQRFPIKYRIADLDITDFTVIYEELAKNGYETARIPFSNMHGRMNGFTNIQNGDNSFYTLHATGLAMGTAPFSAEWKIPVDSTNDKFYLSAEIKDMDMTDFNQLIRPMAPAYVKSGIIKNLKFNSEATSLNATVDMTMEYDSLYIVLLKNMNSNEKNGLYTSVVNRWGIEKQNLGKDMRIPYDTITRDPYHSNFNYFWQILQPPLVESVGVSKEKQNTVHNLLTIYNRIKRFFEKGEKGAKKDKSPQ